jgi:hypothetical protein
MCSERWPPLWYSGQSYWPQIQIFCKVVSLERDPLSLVSTIKKLLERKIRGSDLETEIAAVGDLARRLRDTPLSAKSRYSSFTDSGHGVWFDSEFRAEEKNSTLSAKSRYSSLTDSGHGVCFDFEFRAEEKNPTSCCIDLWINKSITILSYFGKKSLLKQIFTVHVKCFGCIKIWHYCYMCNFWKAVTYVTTSELHKSSSSSSFIVAFKPKAKTTFRWASML